MSKAARPGKIFIDYLRNARGATAIAPYSTRARPDAPISVPLTWQDLSPRTRPDLYDVRYIGKRPESRLRRDPVGGFSGLKQSLTGSIKTLAALRSKDAAPTREVGARPFAMGLPRLLRAYSNLRHIAKRPVATEVGVAKARYVMPETAGQGHKQPIVRHLRILERSPHAEIEAASHQHKRDVVERVRVALAPIRWSTR